MDVTKSLRYRINVSTSVKGVKTWDCTVDYENNLLEVYEYAAMDKTLELSDELVKRLEKRYPVQIEEVKEKK